MAGESDHVQERDGIILSAHLGYWSHIDEQH